MQKIFNFEMKKTNKGARTQFAKVEINLTDKGVFTASGSTIHYGGQCLDLIKNDIIPNETFNTIFEMWGKYHLNDMHAGTPKQEKALKEKFGGVNANIYKEQCEYLKSIGLLVDNGYQFGCGWLKEEIPQEDLQRIKELF